MTQETILLSELVEFLKGSLKKTPKVKNYDKIKDTLLPGLEKSLAEKGDVEVPIAGLKKFVSPS